MSDYAEHLLKSLSPKHRALLARIVDEVEVKELPRLNRKLIRLHHRPTGITVESLFRVGSLQQAYLDALRELFDTLSDVASGKVELAPSRPKKARAQSTRRRCEVCNGVLASAQKRYCSSDCHYAATIACDARTPKLDSEASSPFDDEDSDSIA